MFAGIGGIARLPIPSNPPLPIKSSNAEGFGESGGIEGSYRSGGLPIPSIPLMYSTTFGGIVGLAGIEGTGCPPIPSMWKDLAELGAPSAIYPRPFVPSLLAELNEVEEYVSLSKS